MRSMGEYVRKVIRCFVWSAGLRDAIQHQNVAAYFAFKKHFFAAFDDENKGPFPQTLSFVAICKNEGFSIMTSRKCRSYIITHVLGNAHYRQARVGIKMLEYFNREEALLTANMSINVSSDIIESTFGIYKSKKSPNKLYGVTSFVLTIPLYPKVSNESVTKTINFKERIVNVKLKDISTWSTEHLSKNWVTERTKTLRKVS